MTIGDLQGHAIALGFIDGLRADGPKLPAELSLIGFDNLPASAWTPYRMTTFEQPLDVMVAGVLGHIEAHQTKAFVEPAEVQVPLVRSADCVFYCPPRLVVRQTTLVQS